jgi:hypothetical protein
MHHPVLRGNGAIIGEARGNLLYAERGFLSGSAIIDYEKANALVVSDPEIMGGTPVVRGPRIPVRLIAEMRRRGRR